MNELEKRVRQLEIENIGLQVKLSLLMDKMQITLPELQEYAAKCLEAWPESESNSDIHLYLKGIVTGDPNQD